MRKFNFLLISLVLGGFCSFTLDIPLSDAVETVAHNGIDYVLSKTRGEIVIPADTPETHRVVKGDSLWGIAGLYLGDPFLWPFIWEFNLDHIPNPHLIFPGQLVYLPRPIAPPVESTEGVDVALEEPTPSLEGSGGTDGTAVVAEPEIRRPVVTGSVMETCGYISPLRTETKKIIGAEDPEFQKSEPDLVYVNLGMRDNVSVGDNFYVFQYQRKGSKQ